MSDSIPPIHGALVDLQPNYGAMFRLLGVLSLQVWRYYNHFENDSKYLKLIVAIVWTLSATLILASVVELVVRLFFTYRVWIMSSHNQVLTSVLTLVSLGDFGLGVYEYAITVQNSNLASLGIDPTFHNVGTVSLALSSGNDLAVSLSLIYYLHKGRTSNPRTTSIVKRIVLYTINQGLITR
ncbi:hypothetical protein CPB84DRAFT_1209475 [Gymnopilus junonius]|uniref:DUF6534 domain-containing protein n=1 Tax=Gymnopilus junonius TaxID=109634 RepID=A0A9P5TL69_GYMJU|nr:hypothetical protein CPB84DRAFT_1209475 [Gymnopilus junonius]